MESVSLRYPDADRDALQDVSLQVHPGGSLAIVGATGSGKSTAASLLARLMDPTSGRILLDGVDLRNIEPINLTHLVGVVTQETYLVHDTVRTNLLLAKPDATDDQIWRALAAAQIASLIQGLPEGLETRVGERGHRFSGGEKQRIAVARTMLRDPAVLILDEATSALDNTTEAALQAALDEVARGRTTITIAHRLTTIEDADQIVVLNNGRVVERGTHTQLTTIDGVYASLSRRDTSTHQ